MTISLDYQKRKNTTLFSKIQTNKQLTISKVQNYIPIYERFFSLNNTNWNSINLNNNYFIYDIKDTPNNDENIFQCKIKELDTVEDMTKKTFVKMAPLLDPFKYIIGKYNHNDSSLFELPCFDKSVQIHPKINETNNSSYVDGFFSFLSSKALHKYNFVNGIDFYGSFLAIKHNFKINVYDDIEYLIQSDFFNKQKNILFQVDDYSHLIEQQVTKLKPIKISTSLKSALSTCSLNNEIFEDIFEDNVTTLDDIKNMGVNLEDITNSDMFDISNQHKSETLKSGSTCSSRTSYTNNDENEINDCETDEHELDENEFSDVLEDDNDLDEEISEGSYETIEDDDDEVLNLTFPKFPVQIIFLEQCKETLDYLTMNDELEDEHWFSALMQIIMTLIAYQKMFSFTHNDLHTNNIMYVPTNKKFIYYTYKKNTYKVPTFGRIYKIIDFGRAIYKFNGKIFCSDSFQNGGDASTQYNTEPYFNENKPRLEPNFSFDLCRLACSLFDHFVDDFDMVKTKSNLEKCSPIVKLIVEWCIDDNDINVLYKNDGTERYPDFKLYKMIARCVHKHTPQAQLSRNEFSKYLVPSKSIQKTEIVVNIDEMPVCY